MSPLWGEKHLHQALPLLDTGSYKHNVHFFQESLPCKGMRRALKWQMCFCVVRVNKKQLVFVYVNCCNLFTEPLYKCDQIL